MDPSDRHPCAFQNPKADYDPWCYLEYAASELTDIFVSDAPQTASRSASATRSLQSIRSPMRPPSDAAREHVFPSPGTAATRECRTSRERSDHRSADRT